MNYKNIYIELNINEQLTNVFYEEGAIAIDMNGFIVIEVKGKRDFYDISAVTRWGYEMEEEAVKPTLRLVTDETLN